MAKSFKLNVGGELERASRVPGDELERRISALVALFGTRTYAAEVAELSTDQLSRYEKGGTPSFTPLAKLALAKGVRLEWLATGEEPMYESEPPSQVKSQAARLDPETIVSAVKLLSWAFELQDAVYDPAKDPDLLADTYLFLIEHDGIVTPDNLVDFSKRLAAKRAKEAGGAKHQGPGGATPGSGDPR